MSESRDAILVSTPNATTTRRSAPRELEVEVLAKDVNLFLNQTEGILEKAPDELGEKFRFTGFSVSAEVSAKGGLVLVGSAVEAASKGGLTFRFERM
jgi:hypothetical protein